MLCDLDEDWLII